MRINTISLDTMDSLKLIIVNLFLFCCAIIAAEDTLEQVHVVFRHGDRNPDRDSLYPLDPHLNDTYFPEGLGALTKLGKMQEYKIGKTLRRKYNNFLGEIYTPDILEARSTDYNRTKMSLQLLLAGLWPPTESQIWNSELPWLPVPYNYYPLPEDVLLRYPVDQCPEYRKEFDRVQQLDEFQYFFKKNADLIQYINENSGLNMTNSIDFFNLFFGLYAEEKTGRQLPEWTKKVWPDFIEAGIKICYEIQTYNDELKRAIGGRMIKQVLHDAKSKMNGNLIPKDRKIYLYSGHEYNIAHVLAALKIFKTHIPPYASYILIELHKINGQYGFKIFYQDYKVTKARLMQLPGCDAFCPIEKFEKLHENILLTDENTSC